MWKALRMKRAIARYGFWSDTGNEYWLIEGAYPANIIRKSGIYQSAERAFAAYVEMLQEAHEAEELPDRFHQNIRLDNKS